MLQFGAKVRKPHPKLKACFLVILTGIFLVGGLFSWWIYQAPQLSLNAITHIQSVTQYLDCHGKVFYSNDTLPFQKATHQQFEHAENMKNALLSIEDKDFYHESGTNPKRIGGAMIHDAEQLVGRSSGVQGASTLTQQLIKLSYFSTSAKDRTMKRKVQEMYLAEKLNRRLNKNQILYAYFNKVYLGNGIHGFQTAAKYYFGVNVDQLTPTQAATLAGMVQSPTQYDPYRRPSLTKARRNVVLMAMEKNNKLSQATMKIDQSRPLKYHMSTYVDQIKNLRKRKQDKLLNDNYVTAVNAQMSTMPGSDQATGVRLIKTPFDPAIQKMVNDAVKNQKYPSDHLQTAVVVIKNKTGEVVALNGGRIGSQQVLGGYNRAITSSRSSGSAIKPVLDYAPEFDQFHDTPDSRIGDTPYKYPNSNFDVHDWDNKYEGNITMRRALVSSRNIPAVRNFVRIGNVNAGKLLDALGIPTKNVYAPIAIGTNASPLSLTDAYTALANGGVRSAPQFVKSITYQGQTAKFNSVQTRIFSPGAAYMVTDILKGVFGGEGTAPNARIDGLNQAGKTGSADAGASMPKDAETDAWFIGYTPEYTIGVWTGYDNPYNRQEYLKSSDEHISQDIYKNIMEKIVNQPGYNKQADWQVPSDISKHGNSYNWTNSDTTLGYLSTDTRAKINQSVTSKTNLSKFFNR